ncbi:YegS/Rv2252/BmrU family lipid kinase [Bacillus sp. HMF5848]|uniref:diacylglycerol/lipid kinase family protein n=1 Tax=Bacillus sp. HMF5848 TaxID=2495421 RepID=UPI000F790A38|nr:YegS/Rv2252/BmrU family lipid kinase [Bacillus sp. HMF5848]RSK29041.1 YegS/Rv2252/BmrU family lipid kinase [Bacillus sp. HMF5848]
MINQQAGNGKAMKKWKRFEKKLQRKQLIYKTIVSTSLEDCVRGIIEQRRHITAVIIFGGDGTLHGLLKPLVEQSIPFAIVPAGTGNDFIKTVNKLNDCKLDVVKVNDDSLCATIVGVGFDAEITKLIRDRKLKEKFNKWYVGFFTYIIGVFYAIRTYNPTTMHIFVDGRKYEYNNVWLVATANTPFYGGGLKMCPHANPSDGLLDVCIVHGKNRMLLLFVILPTVLRGWHIFLPYVSYMKGRHITIQSDVTTNVIADGELIGLLPVEITVQQHAMSTFKLNI